MLQGFSTVDGFAEITENVADMIKFVANEPSVGLFYVQHHVRNAAPNLVALKNTVADRSKLTSLHTQDMEDSISMVRSMKESGLSSMDEMIKDINDSISVISSNRGGSLNRSSTSSGFLGRSISWSPAAAFWGIGDGHRQDVQKKKTKNSGGYLSSGFFNTASTEAVDSLESSSKEEETTELDLPLPMSTEVDEEDSQLHTSLSQQQLISLYDDFKADKEAQLEQWLGSEELNKASYIKK